VPPGTVEQSTSKAREARTSSLERSKREISLFDFGFQKKKKKKKKGKNRVSIFKALFPVGD
jgi:hypothetical protein